MAHRPICDIAHDIARDWKPVNFAAVPYLQAMYSLDSVSDDYGMDSGSSIVLYFLSNASTYRGERARELKNELKVMVGQKPVATKERGAARRFKGYAVTLIHTDTDSPKPWNGRRFSSRSEAIKWGKLVKRNSQRAWRNDPTSGTPIHDVSVYGNLASDSSCWDLLETF